MCMPQKSGIEIIEELAHEFPDLKIIAISGGPGSESVTGFTVFEQMLEAALKVGAAVTLTKPVRANVLIENIEALLK